MSRTSLHAVALDFHLMELREPYIFQHDNASVDKASSMKTWLTKGGVEKLESPDLDPTVHFRNELEH